MTAVKNHKQLALRSLLRLKCDYHCQLLLVSVTQKHHEAEDYTELVDWQSIDRCSDRCAASIISAVLQDVGIINEHHSSMGGGNKVRREWVYWLLERKLHRTRRRLLDNFGCQNYTSGRRITRNSLTGSPLVGFHPQLW